jgi:hypothetical protein
MRPRGVPLILLIVLEKRAGKTRWKTFPKHCLAFSPLTAPQGLSSRPELLIPEGVRSGVEGPCVRAGYSNLENALAKEKAQARKLAPNLISISSLADSEG